MKSEIVKLVNVKFERDEKELIKKVIALIGDLRNIGNNSDCDCYEINNISRDTGEFDVVIDFLEDLAYTDVIELT